MPARTAGGAAHTGGEKGARVSVSLHTRSRAEVLEACIHISQHMQHAQGSWSRRSIQYPSPGRARQRQSARHPGVLAAKVRGFGSNLLKWARA